MKYLFTLLLVIAVGFYVLSLNSDRFYGTETELPVEKIDPDSAMELSSVEDEYWPFKNTVQQSDPYVLEVMQELERAD